MTIGIGIFTIILFMITGIMSLNRGYLVGVMVSIVFIIVLLAIVIPESLIMLQ